MSRAGGKLLFAIILIGFGFIYGIEMTKSGIEQINGPLEMTDDRMSEHQLTNPDDGQPSSDESSPLPTLQPAYADKTIHRLANKTERFLEVTLEEGVEAVVALFELIVH